jgi:Flp pilus assembly protein CpaB
VDLLISGELTDVPEVSSLTPSTACYVLQNVEILALDSTLKRTASGSDAAGIAAVDTNTEASRATLAVTPSQVWQLAAVQGNVSGGGVDRQLWLSLRPFGDSAAIGGIPTCSVLAAPNAVPGS